MAWEKEENEDMKYIVSGVVALAAFGLDRIMVFWGMRSSDGWYSPLHMWSICVNWGTIVAVDVDAVGWVVVALAIAAILQGVGSLAKRKMSAEKPKVIMEHVQIKEAVPIKINPSCDNSDSSSSPKEDRMFVFCIVVVIIGVLGIACCLRFYTSAGSAKTSEDGKTIAINATKQPVQSTTITTCELAGDTPVRLLEKTMIAIPGKNYRMCKYEVTQALWRQIMGQDVSRFRGDDLPVECVSWYDCQKFLTKLNAMPEVKASGIVYRLPTAEEWEYACRAGATGKYCKLEDGTEITKETLGEVAWLGGNSGGKTHPIGKKKPNAFGLYDMFGNVAEWMYPVHGDAQDHVYCGREWDDDQNRDYCGSGWDLEDFSLDLVLDRFSDRSDYFYENLGFRLCASTGSEGEEDMIRALEKTMVAIPGKNYRVCKYEVTQALWRHVMGHNSSCFKGDYLPVNSVSWEDCQEFLTKLNAMPEVKASGIVYRLPTADEWEYACRAGATGKYCKFADGTEITKETLGEVAWFDVYSGKDTLSVDDPRSVGRKKSNAFGLYDMLGNVYEWTSTGTDRTCYGGCWYDLAGFCRASCRFDPSVERDPRVGFRLCASISVESK